MKSITLFLVSVFALSTLLFAAPHEAPKPHIKGILPEIFNNASFKKRKQALKAEFKEKEAIDKKREFFKSKIKALELDKKILEINLEEAKAARDESKINATLAQIVQQESKIAQERSTQKQVISEMEQNAINKINKILGY
ncbi:hypothetical protein OQH60_06020 [Campylobacter sp. MIT 21-1685]|uniref:hypothetical protein n=1 Tax=unclassified Campylobacter TaxID=2593542 RepID=UPI00224AE444|nr:MULTISPECIES: hypothetical protein [unclassified Campylobacter]MCX2683373.1 hypothetical protein [Campylobacter sp. MIT 21-1684]MCX2751700.1 hypothetical protein [Campylobacter sp. MIT 21-1682]MCX2807902.1 hypothetical protein [Campylobacter sp. MIT 21-1685]